MKFWLGKKLRGGKDQGFSSLKREMRTLIFFMEEL